MKDFRWVWELPQRHRRGAKGNGKRTGEDSHGGPLVEMKLHPTPTSLACEASPALGYAVDPDWEDEFYGEDPDSLIVDPRISGEDVTAVWKRMNLGDGPSGGVQRPFMRVLLAGCSFRHKDGTRRQPSTPRDIIRVVNALSRADGSGETQACRRGREIFANPHMRRPVKYR